MDVDGDEVAVGLDDWMVAFNGRWREVAVAVVAAGHRSQSLMRMDGRR